VFQPFFRQRAPLVLLVAALVFGAPSKAAAFNLDTDIAPLWVVVPYLHPVLEKISPSGGDASIILRITGLVEVAWFDAIAPYHPTAVGVYSRITRRPAVEGVTNRNKNIALIFASYRVLNSLLPQYASDWKAMVQSVGLNPNNTSQDPTTPIGIGNVAGMSIVAAREHDGMNQLGDEGGRKYNRKPYSDYTGYKPVNTPQDLIDPGRWQPTINTAGGGLFNSQIAVTPQYALTRPFTYTNPAQFQVPAPLLSDPANVAGYKQQADEVLAVSANLTDYQKGLAEFFNDKPDSIGLISWYVGVTRGFTLDQFVQLKFVTGVATFDAGIVVWQEKFKFDTVRPVTAIKYLYGNQNVTAWGGPGKGTVTDIKGSEWRPYLDTADHPEYPSGSACFCEAHAQASRHYLGSDVLGLFIPWLKGTSKVEPGVTPKDHVWLNWPTWTDFQHQCQQSRLYGGVHFQAALDASRDVCTQFGDTAFDFMTKLLNGTAPLSSKQ
jgi:hypothetical protein